MSVDHLTREVHLRLMGYVVIVAPSQPPAFEIQSILLNDSASLRFDEHQALQPDRSQNKDWYLHLCPVWRKKTKKFSQASRHYLALYHVRQPDLLGRSPESNRNGSMSTRPLKNRLIFAETRRSQSKPAPPSVELTCRTKKLVAPTSVGATSLNAVAQGFEPWVAVTPHSISSAAPSAARTRYLGTPQ